MPEKKPAKSGRLSYLALYLVTAVFHTWLGMLLAVALLYSDRG